MYHAKSSYHDATICMYCYSKILISVPENDGVIKILLYTAQGFCDIVSQKCL